tara:strand:- start:598 stop:837 length:240 start_codon:yes stop_codon:yes gene_type:complete
MTNEKIIKTLTPIFQDVFDNENLVINQSSSTENIDGWDSLNHIYLVVAIEKVFKIKFSAEEILNWDSVDQIISSILEKQ